MRLLAISEHFFPRLGGTVSYLHETLNALSSLGVDAELLVPGPEPTDWLPADFAPPAYRLRWIDADFPARSDPDRGQRYKFCTRVARAVDEAISGPTRPDVLHVLFGLFVMETLKTDLLRAAGIRTIATVHNLPPMECGRIRPDAAWSVRLREQFRLAAVTIKNNSRLRRHRYDTYVVPSEEVACRLRSVLPGAEVRVIGHGPTGALVSQMHPAATRRPSAGGPLRLLTVGGYVPHKRQHLIPSTARRLADKGLAIRWDVAGPDGRVPGFFDSIAAEVEASGLREQVVLHRAITVEELAALYDKANLYIQPSTEEGFCLTALDAAAVGLPVIASPAGALPEISTTSRGRLVPSDSVALADAIIDFVANCEWPERSEDTAEAVRKTFSWTAAATALHGLYEAASGA